MFLFEEQCGHERQKARKGIQGTSTFLSNPSRGLPRDGLAGPGPGPNKAWQSLGRGCLGRREAGENPTERMQEAAWSHRSMLSSVGLEKQVCNSFSQNSSSSWYSSCCCSSWQR